MDKGDAEQCYALDPDFFVADQPGKYLEVVSQAVPGMSIDTFWETIDTAKKRMQDDGSIALALSSELKRYAPDDIITFGQIFDVYHKLSDRWLLWSAGNLFNEGLTDDGYHYFRSWLIGRGREAFSEVLNDPDTLAYYDKLGIRHDQAWAETKEQGSKWTGEIPFVDDEGAEYAASHAYEQKCKQVNPASYMDYDSAYIAKALPTEMRQAIHDGVTLHPHINLRIENAEQAADFLPMLKAKHDNGTFVYNRWAHPVEVDGLPFETLDKATPENEQQMG